MNTSTQLICLVKRNSCFSIICETTRVLVNSKQQNLLTSIVLIIYIEQQWDKISPTVQLDLTQAIYSEDLETDSLNWDFQAQFVCSHM